MLLDELLRARCHATLHAFDFGRARQVRARLRQRVHALGHAHAAQRRVGGARDEQRARVGVAHVLAREDEHAARDEERVVARLEHAHHPVDRRVGIAAAHRLDERADDVVVLLAALVVEQRPVALGRRHRLERDVRAAAAWRRGSRPRARAWTGPAARRPAPRRAMARRASSSADRCRAPRPCSGSWSARRSRRARSPALQRLEAEDLAARQQRRVHREARVLGRRADRGRSSRPPREAGTHPAGPC